MRPEDLRETKSNERRWGRTTIVVYVLPQLKELNLRELKVVLREIKETERRVYAGVDTVKQLSLLIGEMLMMHQLNLGRLYSPTFSPLIRIWQTRQLLEISRLIEAAAEDERRLLRFTKLFDALDAAIDRDQSDPGREQAINEAAQKIEEQLEQEIA